MNLFVGAAIWIALALVMAGCGTDGASATAKIQFQKSTARTAGTPDVFKMKMIAAYLTEDIDSVTQNNVGKTTMAWLNPTCGSDIMHCNTDGTSHSGLAEDGRPWVGVITDFFDFSDPTAANTALNSQGRAIDAGTYKYARLEFCKYADAGSAANIQWQATSDGVVSTQSFSRAQCTVNSAAFTTPLTIAAGGSVTIMLTYSLTGTVTSGGAGTNCSSGKCFNPPTFTPSAM